MSIRQWRPVEREDLLPRHGPSWSVTLADPCSAALANEHLLVVENQVGACYILRFMEH